MESAITLAEWFARIIGEIKGTICAIDFEEKAILNFARQRGGKISPRELNTFCRAFRGKGGADCAEKKLREMIDKGKAVSFTEKSEKGGRAKEVFQIPLGVCVCTTPLKHGENDSSADADAVDIPKNDFETADPALLSILFDLADYPHSEPPLTPQGDRTGGRKRREY